MKGIKTGHRNDDNFLGRSAGAGSEKDDGQELGIGLVAWGPLGQGFLTGKITRGMKFDDEIRRAHRRRDVDHAVAHGLSRMRIEILEYSFLRTSAQLDAAMAKQRLDAKLGIYTLPFERWC